MNAELPLHDVRDAIEARAGTLHAERREIDHRARKPLRIVMRAQTVIGFYIGDRAQFGIDVFQAILGARKPHVGRRADTHDLVSEREISDCIAQFAGIEQDIERIVLD